MTGSDGQRDREAEPDGFAFLKTHADTKRLKRGVWGRADQAVAEMVAEGRARELADPNSDVAVDLIRWANVITVCLEMMKIEQEADGE